MQAEPKKKDPASRGILSGRGHRGSVADLPRESSQSLFALNRWGPHLECPELKQHQRMKSKKEQKKKKKHIYIYVYTYKIYVCMERV